MITFDSYQQHAGRFRAEDSSDLRLAINALGVAGEAAEVAAVAPGRASTELMRAAGTLADSIKKHLGYRRPIDEGKLLLELGDVLWYIAEIASAHGMSMSQVAQANIDKLSRRYPDGYSEDAAVAQADAQPLPLLREIAKEAARGRILRDWLDSGEHL